MIALLLAAAAQTQADFQPLFDGKTLNGWVEQGGRYDGDASWNVEDGALVGRQNGDKGGLIYTAKPYTDFELKLECRLDHPFDSGIFVRMAPGGKGAQLTLDYREGGEIGAIYSDGFLLHNPKGMQLWKQDAWNTIEVRCSGKDMRLEAKLNGAPLVDYQLAPGAAGYAPTGLIGLQVHGERNDPKQNACRFRNITLRDLAPTLPEMFVPRADGALELTPWGTANGWRALFNGRDTTGWEEAEGSGGYAVRDGLLTLLQAGDSGYLRTLEDFQDFELRLDFKLAEMTNSGLFLRGARDQTDPAWSACEVQILDDFNWERVTNSKLAAWQFTGSLYGSVPPAKSALKPIGEWNRLGVTLKGSRIATRLNGTTLYDVDTNDVTVPEGKLPFAKRSQKGFIGLQRHAPAELKSEAYAWFRNIYVRTL